jgi:hypothetical protein
MNEFLVTLDVDWAPDWACEAVADELERRDVRATWFVTHATPLLERLRTRPDLHELGVHPNFLPGSTHGDEPEAVLEHVLGIVPEAVSVRSHGLFQWGDLFRLLIERGLRVDSSTFLSGLPGIRPVPQWRDRRSLLRVPFYFSDDHELEKPSPRLELAPHRAVHGLKVFTFHPIHLRLNSARPGPYEELKRHAEDLRDAPRELVERYVESGPGSRTLFEELVDRLAAEGGGRRLADLASASPDRSDDVGEHRTHGLV